MLDRSDIRVMSSSVSGNSLDVDFDPEDVRDISTFLDLPERDVVQRLKTYRPSELGQAWRRANPRTPTEMQHFYASTDLYIWELVQWHATSAYTEKWMAAQHVMEQCPPLKYPHVLDFGCGVGTIALRFAQAGYKVTISDVAGKTLDFARHRFSRRNLPVQILEAPADGIPILNQYYDIFVCIDVLEHLPFPERAIFALGRKLRQNGMAVIWAAWDRNTDYPHHLEENYRRFGVTGNWPIVVNSAGLAQIEPMQYRKVGGWHLLARLLRYHLWLRTGFFLARIPRYSGDSR